MFQVGDKVVCVNDGDYRKNGVLKMDYGLTNGKRYEVYEYKGKPFDPLLLVHIINDRHESQNYTVDRFVSLLEFRKMKINKICKVG